MEEQEKGREEGEGAWRHPQFPTDVRFQFLINQLINDIGKLNYISISTKNLKLSTKIIHINTVVVN